MGQHIHNLAIGVLFKLNPGIFNIKIIGISIPHSPLHILNISSIIGVIQRLPKLPIALHNLNKAFLCILISLRIQFITEFHSCLLYVRHC
jgi:hypothetical protein